MRESDLDGLITAAQLRVEGTRALLARPRSCNAEQCITLLREAQGYLEWARDSIAHAAPVSPALRSRTLHLAGDICLTGILLEQAARSGRRWLEALGAIWPEYTSVGCQAPLELRGRISFTG